MRTEANARLDQNRSSTVTGTLVRYAAGISTIILLLNLYAPAEPPARVRLLASAIIFLGGVPTVAWLLGGGRGVPFMPALGVLYAVYFSMPVLVGERFLPSLRGLILVPEDALEKALALALVGLLTLYAGFLVGSVLFRRIGERRTAWTDANAPVLGGIIGAAGLGVYLYNLSQEAAVGFGQALSLGSSFAVLGGLILYAASKRGLLPRAGWVYLWLVLVPIRVLAGFGTGLNYQGFEIFVAFGLAGAALSRKLPWKAFLVFIVIFIALEPVKAEFREAAIVKRTGEYQNPIENSREYVRIARDVIGETTLAEAVDRFVIRFGYINTFAQVVDATPNVVPYWEGETYASYKEKFLPRVLFPGKAGETTGQEFGHRYGFLDLDDSTTSLNLAQLIEFYVNYGSGGVIVGMFLLGIVYRLFQQFVGGRAGDIGGAVLGAYIFSSLLLIESSLISVLAGALYRLILGLAIGRIMRVIGGSIVYPQALVRDRPGPSAVLPVRP